MYYWLNCAPPKKRRKKEKKKAIRHYSKDTSFVKNRYVRKIRFFFWCISQNYLYFGVWRLINFQKMRCHMTPNYIDFWIHMWILCKDRLSLFLISFSRSWEINTVITYKKMKNTCNFMCKIYKIRVQSGAFQILFSLFLHFSIFKLIDIVSYLEDNTFSSWVLLMPGANPYIYLINKPNFIFYVSDFQKGNKIPSFPCTPYFNWFIFLYTLYNTCLKHIYVQMIHCGAGTQVKKWRRKSRSQLNRLLCPAWDLARQDLT